MTATVSYFPESHIRESNLIENIDSEAEDKQSLLAWEYLAAESTLSHQVICKVQKMITLHQLGLQPHQRGYYRDMSRTNVQVGGMLAPAYELVVPLMTNWVMDFYEKAINPIDAHIRFEKVHPFVDGNGRTGRMLLWWHELKNGTAPTLFMDNNKHIDYYPLFKD